MSSSPLLAPEEEVLSTLRADGHRNWLHPKVAVGAWFQKRRVVGWFLIALFNALPWLRMNGKPMVLLDWIGRKFHLFGITFEISDAFLLALLGLIWMLGIFAVTALLGRVWCGWMCPQTIYLEFVYRPLERLCFGRVGVGGKPAHVAACRRLLLWALYAIVSLWLAHVFLAYFVGVDRLLGLRGHEGWVRRSPLDHPGGFFLIGFVTVAMVFDFAFWREQLCTLACPYGRFQSVLLDRFSPVVAYDALRGEPRGKPRKEKKVALPLLAATAPSGGDCVDCGMCLAVCPTGIDIRKGLQMECLHCTQCVDACDKTMDHFGRPRGLIRYATGATLAGEKKRWLRPRVVLYPMAIALFSALFLHNLANKTGVGMYARRAAGTSYRMLADGRVENSFEVEVVNRTEERRVCAVRFDGLAGALWQADGLGEKEPPVVLAPEETRKFYIRVQVPPTVFGHVLPVMDLTLDDGQGRPQSEKMRLLGPSSVAPAVYSVPIPSPPAP